jgi:hypothetical protein
MKTTTGSAFAPDHRRRRILDRICTCDRLSQTGKNYRRYIGCLTGLKEAMFSLEPKFIIMSVRLASFRPKPPRASRDFIVTGHDGRIHGGREQRIHGVVGCDYDCGPSFKGGFPRQCHSRTVMTHTLWALVLPDPGPAKPVRHPRRISTR